MGVGEVNNAERRIVFIVEQTGEHQAIGAASVQWGALFVMSAISANLKPTERNELEERWRVDVRVPEFDVNERKDGAQDDTNRSNDDVSDAEEIVLAAEPRGRRNYEVFLSAERLHRVVCKRTE